MPRLVVGSHHPSADLVGSPKPAAASSPQWLTASSVPRAASAGLTYPTSPTAAAASASVMSNCISAAPFSENHVASGVSTATAAAAHAIATAAAAAVARELEDRVALAEGRAAAAEGAALEAARAAEMAGKRVASVSAELARATADLGDARGRFEAVAMINQQVRGVNSCEGSSLLHDATSQVFGGLITWKCGGCHHQHQGKQTTHQPLIALWRLCSVPNNPLTKTPCVLSLVTCAASALHIVVRADITTAAAAGDRPVS